MRRACITVVVLLTVLASVADAGREDDFDFAQGLVERKFYDLAEEQFEAIINDRTRPPEQQAAGELGLALLHKAKATDAMNDPDLESKKVLDLFDRAEERFDKFLAGYPGHPKRTTAKFEVGNLLQSKGTYITNRLDKEPEESVEALKKSAETAFEQAIDLFREVARVLEEEAEEGTQEDWDSRRARFYEAVAHYYKGLLYEAGGAERQGVLDRAATLLEDFVWSNEENILGGYAYLYWGLAKKAADQPSEAFDYLSVAASNYQVPDPDENPQGFRIWTDLFLQAYFKMGEYGNELGEVGETDYREMVVEHARQMVERIPRIEDRKWGHFALLEYSRALMGLGRHDEAMDVAVRVSKRGEELGPTTDWGAATAFMANRLITEIISDSKLRGKTLNLPPAELFRAAMGRMTQRLWVPAVASFQGVITAAKTPEEKKEWALKAWMQIGECYYRAGKYLEALFAYDVAEKTFPGTEEAGDAAYYRYRAATALHDVTKDPRDLEMKKKYRSEFATKYKDHPRSIDLQYFEGADFIADGDATLYEEGKEAAFPLYEQAIDRLQGTKKTSILYEKALARIGECLYKLGRYGEALKQFRVVDEKIGEIVTASPERKANRLQARAISAYYGALSYGKMNQWKLVLDELADYETKYDDENVRSFQAPVKFERLRAYANLDMLEEAEEQTLDLRQTFPDSARIPPAFALLGRAFHKKAIESPEGSDEWRKNLEKAGEYFSFYVAQLDTPKWDDWQTIGLWYHKLENWAKSEEFLQKALAIVDAKLEQADTASPEQREKLTKAREGLNLLLSEILIAQGKYPEARKFFEELLIPDPGARNRVMELLEQQGHSEDSLRELMEKIRAVPSLMEGLARVYRHLGGKKELLRALTLVQLLLKAAPDGKWKKETGWVWKYLMCELYLEYGSNFRDLQALRNVVVHVTDWENLGVLANSGKEQEFKQLRARANEKLR